MAHTLVKRMDSAHMKRMYDKALETSDADFLSPSSNLTIDHVRKLNLGDDEKEKIPPRVQNRPPQPPKQKTQPTFSLNSFDALFDEGDAESWLVAPFDEAKRSQLNSAPVYEEKREVVASPVESSVSSELSRSTCVTPASVLDTKSVQKSKCGDTIEGLNLVRPKSVEPGRGGLLDFDEKQRDIRNLPRSVGCINHTPAPQLEQESEPREPSEKTKGAASRLHALDAEKPATKSLGSKLRGRISGITQKEPKMTGSSIPRARARSVGPTKCSRLTVVSPTPRPKSSLGRERNDVKAKRGSLGSKTTTTPLTAKSRLKSTMAARSSASLGTVKEEESEKKKILGFRKSTAQAGPTANLKSTLVNSRLGSKAKKPAAPSRIVPKVPIPRPSLSGTVTENKTASKLVKPSRIASPSPKSFMPTEKAENKDGKGLIGLKKSSSSLPPPSHSSRLRRISQEASKIKQKTTAKKRL